MLAKIFVRNHSSCPTTTNHKATTPFIALSPMLANHAQRLILDVPHASTKIGGDQIAPLKINTPSPASR